MGFAWTPRILPSLFGNNQTVIRGGFRIAYDFTYYNLATNVEQSAPFTDLATLNPGLPNVSSQTGGNIAAALFAQLPANQNPGAATETQLANNLRNPYSQQWNLGVQREIGGKMAAEVRHLGSHTLDNFQEVNGNPDILPLVNAGFQNLIPAGLSPCTNPALPGAQGTDTAGNPVGYANCTFSRVTQYTNSGYSIYNGLQTQFRLQNWHGFTGEVGDTFSKTIDNASEAFSTNGGTVFALARNPFDVTNAERGVSNYSFPNVLTFLWIYDLPYRHQNSEHLPEFSNTPTGFPLGTLVSVNAGCIGSGGATTQCPVTPITAAHWIINNPTAATISGSPFLGVGRNTAQGRPIGTINMSVYKKYQSDGTANDPIPS